MLYVTYDEYMRGETRTSAGQATATTLRGFLHSVDTATPIAQPQGLILSKLVARQHPLKFGPSIKWYSDKKAARMQGRMARAARLAHLQKHAAKAATRAKALNVARAKAANLKLAAVRA